jgi:ubiquinone/menaquinone biosynthesis C-methylase UbiE
MFHQRYGEGKAMKENDDEFDYKHYYTGLYSEEKYSEEMEALDHPLRLRRFQTLLHLIKPKMGNRLLDIGTGNGELLELAIKKRVKAYGIEVSEPRINKCIKKGLNVKHGDAYNIPFPDEYFDYVVISEVLEHLESPSKAMSEIYRVLRLGGAVAITVPIEKLLFTVCIHCGKKTPISIGHLHQFDENKLDNLLTHHFKTLSVTKGINSFMIGKTLFLPFRLWYIFSKIAPKSYSKYIAIAKKESIERS